MDEFKPTACHDDECEHYDAFFDDNCGGQNMENCLKGNNEPVAKPQFHRGVRSPERLKEQLDKLLSVVNAVTCPHRHRQPIRITDLDRLANRQIDVEEALREMGY